jgi:hypothetical protein
MKVKCIANNWKDLFRRTTLVHSNHLSTWPIDIGELYEVYGISLWNGHLHYLVVNRYKSVEQRPWLCPAELFEITNHLLPPSWHFAFQGTEILNDAIWGYEELISVPSHLKGLQEREEDALQIFFNRKREIDEYFRELEK